MGGRLSGKKTDCARSVRANLIPLMVMSGIVFFLYVALRGDGAVCNVFMPIPEGTSRARAALERIGKGRTTVLCVAEVLDMYRGVAASVDAEHLVFSIESQHLAEVYAYNSLCVSEEGVSGAWTHVLPMAEVDAAHGRNPSVSVYIPALPLVAFRVLGEEPALALASNTFGIINSSVAFHKDPQAFFVVCNHWAAPQMLQPFDFRDDSAVKGTPAPILYTYEDSFYQEVTFEAWDLFDRGVRAIPYVENGLFSVDMNHPTPRTRAVYFGGSLELNSNNAAEKMAGKIRAAIHRAAEEAPSLVVIRDTSEVRRANAFRCDRDELVARGETWTHCGTRGYNPWQWEADEYFPIKISTASAMASHDFCLVPRGDTPGTSRLFDAIAAGCIPIVVSDNIPLPFAETVPYQDLIIAIPEDKFIDNPVDTIVHVVENTDVERVRRATISQRNGVCYKGRECLAIAMIVEDHRRARESSRPTPRKQP